MEGFTDKPPYKWKTVRVFISSTFRDFHAERDYLIKYVFPELRQWCEKQKLHLIDIDLRWGVTEKEAKSGKVIELCLEQIDGCRPFFICMLGSRYGWIPNKIERNKVNRKTLKNFPDLKVKWENLSVTHLEILHAALSPLHRREPIPHSFFYFRDKKSLPGKNELNHYSTKQRKEYLETFLEENPQKTEKLKKLKEDIEECFENETDERIFPFTPKFDISLSNPEDDKLKGRFTPESLSTFGNKVKEHLLHALEIQFAGRIQYLSEKREEDSLENERDFHEAFIENRTSLFIGRTALLQRLHDYVNSDSNKILAVYGESGSGKSALLAKFYREFKYDKDENEINQEVLFIPHFIGASPSSSTIHGMLRRFCEEIFNQLLERQMEERLEQVSGDDEDANKEKEEIRKQYEISHDPNKLGLTFKDFLEKANSKVIILIDGLNQLDETDRAQKLDWLPYKLPENVKIIASTLEGKAKDSLKGFTNEQLEVGELDKNERREIIREMPSVFAKTLEEKHINVLLKKKATSNPLYLKVALEELRIFGSFEKLEKKVGDLSDTVIDIFVDVIERLEKEVDKELVERLFCLLECARYGLTENELEELLNDDKKEHIIILRQLRDYFISKDGLIDFFHRGLSKAVKQKYNLDNESINWHKIIAEYFGNQKLYIKIRDKKTPNLRKLSELPFQQTNSKMWNELYITLTDTEFLEQKNTHFIFYELLDDFRTALGEEPGKIEFSEQRNVIQEFNKALDQASQVLNDNPELLFPQIYNRLQWEFDENVLLKNKLEDEKSRFKRPWLRLITPPSEGSAMIRTFFGHTNAVRACSFSFDGRRIVSVSNDNTLKQWDAVTGEVIYTINGYFGDVKAFSPNGKCFVSSMGNKIIQWDTESCKEISTLKGLSGGIDACAFSTDGRRIVSGSYNKTLKVWDVVTGEEIEDLSNNDLAVYSCAFSPDGKRILVGGPDILKMWDVETGKEILTFEGHTDVVTSCAFSPNGKLIVSASEDHTLKLWDAENGKEITTFTGHTWFVNDCAFSPDGKCIISASDDETLKLWDVEIRNQFSNLIGHDFFVNACSFSPDGKRIVSASDDDTLKLWEAETCKELATLSGHSSYVYDCAFSPDGKRLISASDDKTLKIWDSETCNEIATLKGHTETVSSCAFSPDGKLIISGSYDRTLKIWNVETFENISTLKEYNRNKRAFSFSPDSKNIVFGSYDNTLKIWNVGSRGVISTFKGHAGEIKACSFSPDGKHIVSASEDGTLRLWDFETGKEIFTLTGHTGVVHCCAFSPDGKRIVSGGWHFLKLWDAETGDDLATLTGHRGIVYSCAFSPDGKSIVSVDDAEMFNLWNGETGEEKASLRNHTSQVTDFAFSPDGKHIVSASEDETLKLWDAKTGKQNSSPIRHTSSVNSCAFSADNKLIVSASEDKTLKLWDGKTGEEITTLKGHTEGVNLCSFSPDGRRIASGSLYSLKLWDLEQSWEIASYTCSTTTILTPELIDFAFSPNGQRIISSWYDEEERSRVNMIYTFELLDGQSGKFISNLSGHTQQVDICSFSPDGRQIVSGSEDAFKLWDAETGGEIQNLESYFDAIIDFAYSPDGRRIVTVSYNSVMLWDIKTGSKIADFKCHADRVSACAYSPDGRRLIAGTYFSMFYKSDAIELILWDIETGQEILTFKGHKNHIKACAFSPDGRIIISASDDMTLKLWDIESGKLIFTLEGHEDAVTSCDFSPDGKRIVSGSADTTIKLWDSETGKQIITLEGHDDAVTSCAFSPDGKRIVSGSKDVTLKLWDLETGKQVFTLKGHDDEITTCAFSPDGKRIVSGGFEILKLWDVKTGKEINSHEDDLGELIACAYSPDGRHIAYISGDGTYDVLNYKIKLLDSETCKEIFLKDHTGIISSCAYSPDGQRIVTANDDMTLSLWNAETKKQITRLTGEEIACAYSPDGRHIISANQDLKLWDAETKKQISTLIGHRKGVTAFTFSPDNRHIVSVSDDKTLRFWDGRTGKYISTLWGHTDTVKVAFSPDGEHIVFGDGMGQVLLTCFENVELFATIVSPIRTKHYSNKTQKARWDENLKATCQCCGQPFLVSDDILDTILEIYQVANLSPHQSPCLHLPDEAWDDPRLLSECPYCHKPLKFNPFIVDNKDRDQVEPKEESVPEPEPAPIPTPEAPPIPAPEPAPKAEDHLIPYNQGNTYLNAGMFDEAIRSFKEAIRIEPDFAEACNYLGLAYRKAGYLDEAIDAYEKAIKIKPDYDLAYFLLGVAYGLKGKPKDSRKAYKNAIRLNDNDKYAHFNLGLSHKKEGSTIQATYYLERALDLGYEQARAHLDDLKPEVKIENAEDHYNLGEQNWQDGKIEEAIKEYKETIRIDPDHISAHFFLGCAYLEQDQSEEAMREYKEVIRIDPDNADAHCAIGTVLKSEGQLEEAIEEYKIAVRINEDHALSHFNLGTSYMRFGNTSKAKYHFKNALDLGYEEARPFVKKWWQS